MKHVIVGFLIIVTLVACSRNAPSLKRDMIGNNWQQRVDTSPDKWFAGADDWFFTAKGSLKPYAIELPVTPFTRITSNGDFRLRIMGTSGHNRAWIVGPPDAVHAVLPSVRNGTFFINQEKKPPSNMAKVIVYVYVNQLTKLSQQACGSIEGVMLRSQSLEVVNTGCGNMYLAGQINVSRIYQRGGGSINLFGIRTNNLVIDACGSGNVNVGGNINVRSILHCGGGNVNILGANSRDLCVYAKGTGKVAINGTVNLRRLETHDYAGVYIYPVVSNRLEIMSYNASRVALAGCVKQLSVDTYNTSRFEGRDLCTEAAYVKAHDNSDINVIATQKLFAATSGAGSVYYFNQPPIFETFVSAQGNIIPIHAPGGAMCIGGAYPTKYAGDVYKVTKRYSG